MVTNTTDNNCGSWHRASMMHLSASYVAMTVIMLAVGMAALTAPDIMPAYAQAGSDNEDEAPRGERIVRQAPIISVVTDKPEYVDGDIIIISGEIATRLVDTPVILQIFKDNNPVYINQITPAGDNTYWDVVRAEGSKWEREGQYNINIRYGPDGKATTEFDFAPTPGGGGQNVQPPTEGHFEVDAGNETFDVLYSISGGTVTDMVLDWRDFTLVVEIEMQDDNAGVGHITLDMPRKYIGSEKTQGNRISDEVFIILVDGIQTPYEEAAADPNSRKIKVDIARGDSEIRVIGTYAVPEFEQMIMLFALLAGGMLVIIAVTRARCMPWRDACMVNNAQHNCG